VGQHAAQSTLALAFLPFEATVNLDAILRTAWRMLVTHRRLLEWNPSAAREPAKSMWIAPVVASGAIVALALTAAPAFAQAAPILLLWLASPGIAWWVSRPLAHHEPRLSAQESLFLRKLARKTWGFFDTFVGPEDHWLPPDNFQEHPVAAVAHRTSPTNMGLALLANLAAYDFGYLPAGALIARTASTLETMKSLERYEGHFYNWYDTQSLAALKPLYVSAVDSGNLAGHLMTLRQGMLALADDPIVDARWFRGLADTLIASGEDGAGPAPASLERLERDLDAASQSPPATLAAARLALEGLEADSTGWADALIRHFRMLREELASFGPSAPASIA